MPIIDNRLLEPNCEQDIIEDMNRILNEIDDISPEKFIQLDFDATLTDGVITGTLAESVSSYNFLQNNEYLINIKLPITNLLADLSDNTTIKLKDADNNDVIINNIFAGTSTVTVGDMKNLQNYDSTNGYSWKFLGYYTEVSNVKAFYTTDVQRETVTAMTGTEFNTKLTANTLKSGTIVEITDTYLTYTKGHRYKVIGTWTDNELVLTAEDLDLITDFKIKGNLTTDTIATAGKYLYVGDVDELIITAEESLQVVILGTLGTLTLPATSKTVQINAKAYSGATLDATAVAPCTDGSVIGQYVIRATALQ